MTGVFKTTTGIEVGMIDCDIIHLLSQTTYTGFTVLMNGVKFYSINGLWSWVSYADGFSRTFDGALTQNVTYTLSDTSDTIALTTATQNFIAKQLDDSTTYYTSNPNGDVQFSLSNQATGTTYTLSASQQVTQTVVYESTEIGSYFPLYATTLNVGANTIGTKDYYGGVCQISTDVVVGHIVTFDGGTGAGTQTFQIALYQTVDGSHPRSGNVPNLVAYTNYTGTSNQQFNTRAWTSPTTATFLAGWLVIIWGQVGGVQAAYNQWTTDAGMSLVWNSPASGGGEGPHNFTTTTACTTTPPSTFDITAGAVSASTGTPWLPFFLLQV